MSRLLAVDVWFDFICPWCLIGKRQLDKALALLRQSEPQVQVAVRWHGVQLLPQAPAEGWPFMEFYVRRLGSEAAVRQRQAMVLDAAHAAGVELDFGRLRLMPNTADAHRLFAAACTAGTPEQANALLERLFAAHFSDGADLGAPATLLAAADACGLPAALGGVLCGADEPYAPPAGSVPDPLSGVPCFEFDGWLALSGAQPPAALLAAMRRALAIGTP